jgi:hypothetical protein
MGGAESAAAGAGPRQPAVQPQVRLLGGWGQSVCGKHAMVLGENVKDCACVGRWKTSRVFHR